MKAGARRTTLATVVVGCLVMAWGAVANWVAVRDHVAAWWFQTTRATAEVKPSARFRRLEGTWRRPYSLETQRETPPLTDWGWRFLASDSDRVVIFDEDQDPWWAFEFDWDSPTVEETLTLLRERGYHVVDQRFPRLAYVVVARPPRPSTPAAR